MPDLPMDPLLTTALSVGMLEPVTAETEPHLRQLLQAALNAEHVSLLTDDYPLLTEADRSVLVLSGLRQLRPELRAALPELTGLPGWELDEAEQSGVLTLQDVRGRVADSRPQIRGLSDQDLGNFYLSMLVGAPPDGTNLGRLALRSVALMEMGQRAMMWSGLRPGNASLQEIEDAFFFEVPRRQAPPTHDHFYAALLAIGAIVASAGGDS